MDRRELLKIMLGGCAATLVPSGLAEHALAQSSEVPAFPGQKAAAPALEWLSMGEVKPAGWIRQQMLRDLDTGFAGSLGKLCHEASSDIFVSGRNSTKAQNRSNELGVNWWNGETEGNWRAGYFMMAYLTEDPAAMQEADRYVAHILASQDADGYLGVFAPDLRFTHQGELWTQACLLRGLLAYWELTHKPEVYRAVCRAMDLDIATYQTHGTPLPKGESHDLMIIDVAERLYQISGDPKYLDFAVWFYDTWSKNESKWDATLSSLLDGSKGFKDHGVHTYENIRVPLFLASATQRPDLRQAADNALVKTVRYLEPAGSGVSEEMIGNLQPDPWHTEYEYCATKELQLTFESAMQKTGRGEYADRAEWIWFNAAQGARLPDGSAISYLTSDDRMRCDGLSLDGKQAEPRNKFSPTHKDVAVCCNPNATQVAALFVRGMWMRHHDGSLVAMLYGPSTVSTEVHGVPIQIEQRTQYPFRPTVEFVIHPERELSAALRFRNPGWSQNTRVTCAGARVRREGDYWVVRKPWRAGDTVQIAFSPEVQKIPVVDGEIAIRYGALVFAEPKPATRVNVKSYGLGDFEDTYYRPETPDASSTESQRVLRLSDLNVEYPPGEPNGSHPFDTPLISLTGHLMGASQEPPKPIVLVPLGNAPTLRRLTFAEG
jgi:uncharacterized protein